MAYYEEGLYECEIRKQFFAENAKGTEYFGLTIYPKTRIKDKLREPQDGPYERTVCLWTNSPNNVERTIEQVRDLGWDGKGGFTSLDPSNTDHFSLVGKVVRLRGTHNTSGDKVYDHFQFPRLEGGTKSPENDSDIAKRLDRLYKLDKKKVKTKAGKSYTAEEEVPF